MKRTVAFFTVGLGVLAGAVPPGRASPSRSSKNQVKVDPEGRTLVFPHLVIRDVARVDAYIHEKFPKHAVVFFGRHLTLLDTWRRAHDPGNTYVLPLSKAEKLPTIDAECTKQMWDHFDQHLPALESISELPILAVDTASGSWRKLQLAYRFFMDYWRSRGQKNPVDLLALAYKKDRAIALKWSKEEKKHLYKWNLRTNAPALAKMLHSPEGMDAFSLFAHNPVDRPAQGHLLPRIANAWLQEWLINDGLIELENEIE